MLTNEVLAEGERLVKALDSYCKDAGGSQSVGGMTFIGESGVDGDYHSASVIYPDGDHCAEVDGNLGLGFDGDAYAEYFAFAVNHAAALIATARQHAAIVAEAQRLIRMAKDLAGDKYGGDGPNHYGLAKEVHDGLAECLRMIEPQQPNGQE
jgi:hypothetical protein